MLNLLCLIWAQESFWEVPKLIIGLQKVWFQKIQEDEGRKKKNSLKLCIPRNMSQYLWYTVTSRSWHRLLWGGKCGRAKLSGGLVQEVRLIGGDREGGGSVCVSVLLPSLYFTLCEDQCRRRTIVTRQINPIKVKRVSFYSLRGMRQAELTSCTICSLFNQFPQLRRSAWWAVEYKACPCIHAYFTSLDIWRCLMQCT